MVNSSKSNSYSIDNFIKNFFYFTLRFKRNLFHFGRLFLSYRASHDRVKKNLRLTEQQEHQDDEAK
jgi:hypothetical protein